MLQAIQLQHFKAFREMNNLAIKPITVFCGTNSCGKSTILQSILLAKQTLESRHPGQRLQLNGRFVRLGTFENIIFEKNPQSEVVLGFSFCGKRDSYTKMPSESLPTRFIIERLFPEKTLRIARAEYLFHYRFAFQIGEKRSPRTHLKPIVATGVELRAETRLTNGEIIEGPELKFQLKEKDQYIVAWKNSPSKRYRSGRETARVRFANMLPDSIHGVNMPQTKGRSSDTNLIAFSFSQLLQSLFSMFTFIGPVREEPSRRYIYENEILEIGLKGENAAYIYNTDYDKRIKDCHFYDSKTDSFYKRKESPRLGDALALWLDVMGIEGLSPTPRNEIVYLDLKSNSSSNKTLVNIADVGFGVSQILPIVLEGLRMPTGKTLVLEQPEIHLHPNLQMQMADYFISLALSKKRVIVETHSDHIINRLVRRIVEDQNFNLEELIRIYFVTLTPEGSRCEEVHIDPERGIVNWPDGFFDQTASEQQRTVQAGLRKRQSRKADLEARR